MMFQIEYNFQPLDRVYVVLPADDSIQAGEITQVTGLVYGSQPTTVVQYYVLLDGAPGSVLVSDDRTFATLGEALLFAQALITSASSG